MPLQGVEPVGPHPPVRRQPRIDLGKRVRVQLVPPALGVPADANQPGLPQHPQLLGRARLGQPQLPGQVADQPRAVPEQVEDVPPGRLGKHLERGDHAPNIADQLYTCNSM